MRLTFAFSDCQVAHAAKWTQPQANRPWRAGQQLLQRRRFDQRSRMEYGPIADWSHRFGAGSSLTDFRNFTPSSGGARGYSISTHFPGGRFSVGISVNNAGQVVGFSETMTYLTPSTCSPTGTQTRTFLWHDGNMEDIGTLGGPDAAPGPGCDNQRPGVIVGTSYTSYTPNTDSGIPTQDPFLWDNGTMTDLGNLGGTFNFGQCANAHLEVIGNSNLPDDQTFHGYRWRNGKMKDLGTLGGPDSEAVWINDAGDIAGSADLPTPGIHDAVVWIHGQIHDLGSLPGDACSRGRAINSRGQVVGGTSDCRNFLHAFVWEQGGPMRDLNKLIPPDSGLQLTNAFNINDRGEILAKSFPIGTTPNDDADLGHLVLLIPCAQEDHERGCSDHDRDGDAVTPPVSTLATARAAASLALHIL